MTLENRLDELVAEIGADIKAIFSQLPSTAAGFGQELAYAEKTVDFTSTNITPYNVAAGAVIPGLSITVPGTGRPFDLIFRSLVRHSVANTIVAATLMVDGAAEGELEPALSFSTTTNIRCFMMKRMAPVAIGTDKTYQIASYAMAAGTTTWAASTANKMTLLARGA